MASLQRRTHGERPSTMPGKSDLPLVMRLLDDIFDPFGGPLPPFGNPFGGLTGD
jgi:hypothetical protein